MFVTEVGSLIPGAEVVIADVSNGGQCGVGRLGEVDTNIISIFINPIFQIWVRADWICSSYTASYGGQPHTPVEELQKMLSARLEVGNDKGLWAKTGATARVLTTID